MSSRGAESPARRNRTKKPSQDISRDSTADTTPNPDPAVFEAAFVIDDPEDAPPTPPVKEVDGEAAPGASTTSSEKPNGVADKMGSTEDVQPSSAATHPNSERTDPPKRPGDQAEDTGNAGVTELPADVRAKLKKLEKIEKSYGGMQILRPKTGMAPMYSTY